ncbi:MAG: hypothetical protein HDS11_01515 [Bacteroides sp.]|nr:hypothetical protein [Bacteroidales bacterium]MBD5316335.1 hypothetical protein [Bacteroides sp.]MBD5377657.1 hypothetical protein [Bacteroides sp.]
MKTIILAVILIGAALVLLGVKVLFVRGGRFPSGHVHEIPALRDRGVSCASGHSSRRRAEANRNSSISKNEKVSHLS